MKPIMLPELLPFTTVALALKQHIISGDVCSPSLLSPLFSQQNRLEVCRPSDQDNFSPLFVTNSSSPWISRSNCRNNTETFCAFSSSGFAGGRGISIVTTPDRIESLQHLPAFADADALSGINEQLSPAFEERELPGRGRGLIANKTLHRGDRIFAHTPILILDGEIFGDLEQEEWLELEHAAVNKLPLKTRAMFSALYGRPVTDPVSDRIDTNAFVLELNEVTYYAVFPETAVSAQSISFQKQTKRIPVLTTSSALTMTAALMPPIFLTNKLSHTTYTLLQISLLVLRLP